MNDTKKLVIFIVSMLVIGFGYLAWLDSDCEMGGAMTGQGKVCIEDLFKN